jgi:Type II/IV secretion system protein
VEPAATPAPKLKLRQLEARARKLFESTFYDASDFTIVLPDKLFKDLKLHWWYRYCCLKHGPIASDSKAKIRRTSFEFQETVLKRPARLQISRAMDGKAWTVSVRWDPPKDFLKGKPNRKPFDRSAQEKAASLLKRSKWRPQVEYGFAEADAVKSPWLFSVADVISSLHARIEEAENPGTGFILVTGSTNAAKSKIARGLIWKRLEAAIKPNAKRKPHLITYEDPIEEFLWPPEQLPPNLERKRQPPLDYTPRKANSDCSTLHQALNDALRQTPTVFYIGEVRNELDLRRAVEFGGTGHLVVATAHAGNLIEAVGKILNAVSAEQSGTRAVYVPKILAVIHLVTLEARIQMTSENEQRTLSGIVPAMYRRSPRGMQDLISDGLVSLMPHYPSRDQASQFGSLGRQFFARELCNARFHRLQKADQPKRGAGQKLLKTWSAIRRGNTREHPGDRKLGTVYSIEEPLINVALLEDLNGR